jgi:regulator of RNase E activity RraA
MSDPRGIAYPSGVDHGVAIWRRASRQLEMPSSHGRPSAPTNISLRYKTDVNVPIGSGDTPVFPGDIIVGDADGVIVIPAGIVEEITTDAIEMTAYEEFVTEPVRAGQKTLGLYPPTNQAKLDAFAVWRKKHGR